MTTLENKKAEFTAKAVNLVNEMGLYPTAVKIELTSFYEMVIIINQLFKATPKASAFMADLRRLRAAICKIEVLEFGQPQWVLDVEKELKG